MQFVWYDYETWGNRPMYDRPVQFASIRTDKDLKQIGEPKNWLCRPGEDCIISPGAVAVHRKYPKYALKHGLSEAEFAGRIHRELTGRGHTCMVGYNAMKFDHEATRHLLYRNLRDPYKWHWAEGNARMDLIHLVSAVRLLNPGALRCWPENKDGTPIFRLGDLLKGNVDDLAGQSHDALVDVRDMLNLARILKRKSPKLFDHALKMVRKEHVSDECGDSFLFVSPFIPGKGRYATILSRLAPDTKMGWFWSFDLSKDPTPLQKPFASWSDEDRKRAARWVRRIKTNEAPFVRHCPLPVETPRAEKTFRAMKLTSAQVQDNLKRLKANQSPIDDYCKSVEEQWEERDSQSADADYALYSGGFWTRKQQWQMKDVIDAAGDASQWQRKFDDDRLEALVFRYRARNFPESLTIAEMERWRAYCRSRHQTVWGGLNPAKQWIEGMAKLRENPENADLVAQLEDWHAGVRASIGLD